MYRPLACVMAWAHRKVELSKFEYIQINKRVLVDGLSTADRDP